MSKKREKEGVKKPENRISQLMTRHHQRIRDLLIAFKSNMYKDSELMGRSFNSFKNELRGHISMEEEAIFKFCDLIECRASVSTIHLVERHGAILDMLNTLENDLVTKDEIDISEFQKFLQEHKDFEDKILYPKLDRELSESQKEIVIERINKMSSISQEDNSKN